MTSTISSKAPAGAALLQRLQAMADGVDKHKADPGFPNYFATVNLHAEHDEVGGAILDAKVALADERTLRVSVVSRAPAMRELYQRGVAAIEAFFGPDSATLGEFSVRPRKGSYSSHKLGAAKGKRTRRSKKAAAGAAATAPAVPATGAR